MKKIKLYFLQQYSIFFWLILITVLGLFASKIYSINKSENLKRINSSINNIYLKKTIKEITNNLNPRFTYLNYFSKSGDTYQSIVNKLNINQNEKKIVLETILKEKTLKILRINQKLKILRINKKFSFKIDNLSNNEIIEFRIQTDKKNEILFTRFSEDIDFKSERIKKNLTKKLVYKETIITDSLYNSAINLKK